MLPVETSITPEDVVSFTRTAAPYLWGLYLMTLLAQPLLQAENRRYSLQLYRRIRPRHLATTLVVIALTFAAYGAFSTFVPALNYSWISSQSSGANGSNEGTNILIAPLTLPWLGPVFLLLLAANMPLLTQLEERLFRGGTRSYLEAVPRSLIFGLVHCAVGVPIAAGLALAIPGMWFSRQYIIGERKDPANYSGVEAAIPRLSRIPVLRRVAAEMACDEGGGVARAALHHTCYNMTLLTIASGLLLVAVLG